MGHSERVAVFADERDKMEGVIWFIEGELFGMAVFGLGGLIWPLIPALDKKAAKSKSSKLVVAFGVLVVLFILAMTIIGYLVE